MQSEKPEDTPRAASSELARWFATPQGMYVLAWEQAQLDALLNDLFGYVALQVGLPEIDFLRANRMPTRLNAALDGAPQVIADACELPFASESLDLLLLPHLLESTEEPHQMLREAERVLRPEGSLIVSGFNPFSFWGTKRVFTRLKEAPWDAEFVSVLRMKDWLKLLNFEVQGGRFGCYRFPFGSQRWLSRFASLETLGARWWPVAGGVYVMQAKKRVPGMRVLSPAWRRGRRAAGALSPTTHKTQIKE